MEPADDASALPSPLAQTLARLRLANPYLRAHLGSLDKAGGFSLGTIHDATQPLLDTHLGAMAAHYQTDEREVLARFYLSGLSFHLAHFAVGAFVREQRVPVLEPAAMGLVCNAMGFPTALTLAGERFACLPGDHAAAHPHALPVTDLEELRNQLHAELVRAFQPLVTALRQRARLGDRALWIAAAEACASALVEALPPGTAVETARAELAALLGAQHSPLRASPEVIGVVGTLGILGTDCCAMFRLPHQPYCATCPHLPHDARLASLQAWLAAKAQES